jgi:hypothetical protein
MTYEIKTHNPWSSILGLIITLILPICFLSYKSESEIEEILLTVIFVLGSQMICYRLIAETIEVEFTDKGIKSSWMISPSFSKINKEILWKDIEYWNFVSTKLGDVFILKTKDKQGFSIRCLRIYSTQSQFKTFVRDFAERVDLMNKEQVNDENKIKPVPSIFASKFGIALAIIILIGLIALTYILKTESHKNGSGFLFDSVFIYLYGFSIIGFVVAYQLVKRRKNRNK